MRGYRPYGPRGQVNMAHDTSDSNFYDDHNQINMMDMGTEHDVYDDYAYNQDMYNLPYDPTMYDPTFDSYDPLFDQAYSGQPLSQQGGTSVSNEGATEKPKNM